MHQLLIQGMFRSIDARDWSTLQHVFAEEVVYERPGYEPIRGLEALMHFYREVRIIASGTHALEGVIEQSGSAAAWGRFQGTCRDGLALDERFVDVYANSGGGIVSPVTSFHRPGT